MAETRGLRSQTGQPPVSDAELVSRHLHPDDDLTSFSSGELHPDDDLTSFSSGELRMVTRYIRRGAWYVQRCTLSYMATMTISEARAALAEVLDRVGRGEEVTITRHGRPVAIVVRPDTLRSRRAEQAMRTADQTRVALAAGRRSALSCTTGITAERADELVSAIRTDRDAQP